MHTAKRWFSVLFGKCNSAPKRDEGPPEALVLFLSYQMTPKRKHYHGGKGGEYYAAGGKVCVTMVPGSEDGGSGSGGHASHEDADAKGHLFLS